MNKLTQALSKYKSSLDQMGDVETIAPIKEKEEAKRKLASVLAKIKSKNDNFFWVLITMTVITFLLSCYLILHFMDNPDKLKLLFGVTGITLSGLLFFMQKIWKEKTAIDMLLALISSLDPESIKMVAAALVNNYLNGK